MEIEWVSVSAMRIHRKNSRPEKELTPPTIMAKITCFIFVARIGRFIHPYHSAISFARWQQGLNAKP